MPMGILSGQKRMRNIGRHVGNAILYRIISLLIRLQLVFQLKLGFLKTYAPNAFLDESKTYGDERDSYERLRAIDKFLPGDRPFTTLDIGCNLGFFTFNMAKRGGLCIGIDYGRNEILAAKALASRNSIKNVVLTKWKLQQITHHICLMLIL